MSENWTKDELTKQLFDTSRPYYQDQRWYCTWHEHLIYTTETPEEFSTWLYAENDKEIDDDFEKYYPNFDDVEDFNFLTFTGTYLSKKVRWSRSQHRWVYLNNRPVDFTEEKTSDEEGQVSALLERAVTAVASATASVTGTPRAQTPSQPSFSLPGGFLDTPGAGPSATSHLPTPQSLLVQARDEEAPTPLVPRPQSPQRRFAPPPVAPVYQAPLIAAPPAPAPMAAPAPKALGTPPEPFDGKPEKAEAFWNQVDNYYYLNQDLYTNEDKRVSAALTHFKVGTPGGEWARELQKTALDATPITFGTWADFKTAFRKHFIPVETELESTSKMYSCHMNQRNFEDWYQEWANHASKANVDEKTKMYAFRKMINPALHTKIMGVSPTPTTMNDLVEKAREFDKVWRIFSSPAFTGGSRRPRSAQNRALNTEEPTNIQVNAIPGNSPPRSKLSKEERQRRFAEKLCFYCAKPGHVARDCRAKTNAMKSRTQGRNAKARALITESEEPIIEEDDLDDQQITVSSLRNWYNRAGEHERLLANDIIRPQSAPVSHDF